MQYIFEDNENSLLSKLFRAAYPESVIANFHYTRGNGKMLTYITKTFKSKDEELTVFLDMPPGNPDVVEIYNNLGNKLMGAYSSFMIYPFVCMEYYYLKFIRNSALVTNPAWIETCLSFGLLSDTNPPILGLEDDAADYTTYENFCKIVARKALAQCARIGTLSKQEDRARPFFTEDCLCKTNLVNSECHSWSLIDKSEEFTRLFPARPAFHNKAGERVATCEERVMLHRKLVSHYNSISAVMCKHDGVNEELYLKLDPLV